jgi:hypothetical protein
MMVWVNLGSWLAAAPVASELRRRQKVAECLVGPLQGEGEGKSACASDRLLLGPREPPGEAQPVQRPEGPGRSRNVSAGGQA